MSTVILHNFVATDKLTSFLDRSTILTTSLHALTTSNGKNINIHKTYGNETPFKLYQSHVSLCNGNHALHIKVNRNETLSAKLNDNLTFDEDTKLYIHSNSYSM
eukprot:13540_1